MSCSRHHWGSWFQQDVRIVWQLYTHVLLPVGHAYSNKTSIIIDNIIIEINTSWSTWERVTTIRCELGHVSIMSFADGGILHSNWAITDKQEVGKSLNQIYTPWKGSRGLSSLISSRLSTEERPKVEVSSFLQKVSYILSTLWLCLTRLQIILLDTSTKNRPIKVVHHIYNMHLSYSHRRKRRASRKTQWTEIYSA